jgi:hypothetical protein
MESRAMKLVERERWRRGERVREGRVQLWARFFGEGQSGFFFDGD